MSSFWDTINNTIKSIPVPTISKTPAPSIYDKGMSKPVDPTVNMSKPVSPVVKTPAPVKSSTGSFWDTINNTVKNIPVPTIPKSSPTPIPKATFGDLAQAPSAALGKFLIEKAWNFLSSTKELATGTPLPKLNIPSFTPGYDYTNGSSYQQKYIDAVTNGMSEKDAYKQTLVEGIMDAIALSGPIEGGIKFGLTKLAPTSLIDSSIKNISKDTLYDYFSGRKTAEQLGFSPEVKASITSKIKAMSTQEKAQFLQGFDLLNAKPSTMGKMFGVTDAEAQKILNDIYNGPVRQTSAGALPGYQMNPQAGAINPKGTPVGFGEEPQVNNAESGRQQILKENTQSIQEKGGQVLAPEKATELTNWMSKTGGFLTESDIPKIYDKYGNISIAVKDVNGQRARMSIEDFQKLAQNKAFTDRIRAVFVGGHSFELNRAPDFDPQFMEALQPKKLLEGGGKQSISVPLPKIDGIKLSNNSTIHSTQQAKYVEMIQNPRVRDLLKQNGIKEINIEAPHKFGLSEQAHILKGKKIINISADATNPTQTILHELGHAYFEDLPKAKQDALIELAKNTTNPEMQGYKNISAWEEIIADSIYNDPNFLPKEISLPSPINTVPHLKHDLAGNEVPYTAREKAIVAQSKSVPFMPNKVVPESNLPELRVSKLQPKEKNSSQQDTTNKVDYQVSGNTPKEKVQSIIVNSVRAENELKSAGQDALYTGQKITLKDRLLVDKFVDAKDYSNPADTSVSIPILELAKQSSNPKAFIDYAKKLLNFHDLSLASQRAAAIDEKIIKIDRYTGKQRWEETPPKEVVEAYNNIAKQKGLQPWSGISNKSRIFKSYPEGESYDFTRKNADPLDDLKMDIAHITKTIPQQVLRQGLLKTLGSSIKNIPYLEQTIKKAMDAGSTSQEILDIIKQQLNPKEVNLKGMGRTVTGRSFVNLNIPGLEGLSVHPDIAKLLKGFQPRTGGDFWKELNDMHNNPTVQLLDKKGNWGPKQAAQYYEAFKKTGTVDVAGSFYDKGNKNAKLLLYNLSGFHSLNISLQYGGKMLLTNPLHGAATIVKSLRALVSEDYTQKLIEQAKNEIVPGTKKSVFQAGLEMGFNMVRELDPTGKAKYNILKVSSHMIFDRELHILKLSTVRIAARTLAKKGISFNSPEGRQLGIEGNQLMGELNQKIQNIDPNVMKWLGRGLGAPQFTVSKIGIYKDALIQWGPEGSRLLGSPAGNFARQAVVGKQIITILFAALGTIIATGNMPKLKDLFLTPDPVSKTNLKNPKGKQLDVTYPRTYLGEATGALTDPIQYLMDRLAPGVRVPMEINTPWWKGRDQFGNPTVNVNKKESALSQEVKAIATGFAPIGGQAVINALSGKITPAQAGIAVGGLKTKVSADDPTTLKYKAIDDAASAIARIAPDDPKRTEKIQAIYNTLTVDQRKSLNYQELLAGVSTKGVLFSDTGKLKPLYDQLQVMKANGQTAEANAIWNKLSKEDKVLYAKVKTYYKKTATSQAEKDFEPTFQIIRDMKTSGDPALEAQADEQYNALTPAEKKIYQLLKKQNL